MNYISMFSGIEAASVAFHPLGWEAICLAEIEAFPSAVLAHHYPDAPNVGDMTAHDWSQYRGRCDLVVGGPPCQAFSVAGLRRSLDDDRGNLSLQYMKAIHAIDPIWSITENVPGWLSTKDNAFGCFLAGLVGEDAELLPPGGRWTDAGMASGPERTAAWRCLDAQYFGLAQRRKRVFVLSVRGSGNWRCAEALFPLTEGVQRHPAPRREAGEGTAAGTAQRPSGGGDSGLIPEVCPTLVANGNKTGGIRPPGTDGDAVTSLIVMARGQSNAPVSENDQCPALTCLHEAPIIAHTLSTQCAWATEDGTGRGSPLVAHAFDARQSDVIQYGDMTGPLDTDGHTIGVLAFSVKDHGADAVPISPTLRAGGFNKSHANGGVMPAVAFSIMPMNSGKDYKARETDIAQPIMAGGPVGGNQGGDYVVQPAVAFDLRGREGGAQFEGPHDTANIMAASGGSSRSYVAAMQVRRLTPRECERLQGFPDDYTLVPYRNKPASDGPRYKALGNSMAVPCMAWIGQRIAMVEQLAADGASPAQAKVRTI